MGDCTLGSAPDSDQYNNFDAYQSVYGIDYFFQNVKSYLEGDDLSIINLEGALTTAENSASKSDVYKGDPSYVSHSLTVRSRLSTLPTITPKITEPPV